MPSWSDLLNELSENNDGTGKTGLTLDGLREKYLKKLTSFTNRNVIAYYSGWLKTGKDQNVDINDSDITGFMNAIKGMDTTKGLDLILHTPGGNPTATEGIVKYIHKKFGNDIRVIVPQMAMSAGTMLACSAKEIIMGAHSCLGPIDPQFGGIPAYNIVSEFTEAKKDIENNPKSKSFWELQLKKYPPAFFYSVVDAINLSNTLTSEWLSTYMFAGETDIKKTKDKIKQVLTKLNSNNQSHSRHFSYDDCKQMGLNVTKLEDDNNLQDCVLSIHHSYVITNDHSNVTKIIENDKGARYLTKQAK